MSIIYIYMTIIIIEEEVMNLKWFIVGGRGRSWRGKRRDGSVKNLVYVHILKT